MITNQDSLFKDFEAVRKIAIVPTMLEVICQITGMEFSAIARVTNDRWLACSVRDEVQFGLAAGNELQLQTTLCNEIRDHRRPIIIENVAESHEFKNHHTPRIYGLQSYISFPIILKDGSFFGTLCAISSKPAELNNTKTIGTFSMFAELLSFHLQSLDLLEQSYCTTLELSKKNKILTNVNNDLDTFVYTASHDLKSPINNIESLLNILSESITEEKLDRERIQYVIGLMKSDLKRFAGTIRDLTTFVEADNDVTEGIPEEINIFEVVEDVKQDLQNLVQDSEAKIKVIAIDKVSINFSKKKFKSILYNLLSNAIKYRSPERTPEILVQMDKVDERLKLSVSDNGLGIPPTQIDKLFTMFKRFHNHVDGSGLGLYIVKRIIDNMEGQIQVNSSVNQGTTFTISF